MNFFNKVLKNELLLLPTLGPKQEIAPGQVIWILQDAYTTSANIASSYPHLDMILKCVQFILMKMGAQ